MSLAIGTYLCLVQGRVLVGRCREGKLRRTNQPWLPSFLNVLSRIDQGLSTRVKVRVMVDFDSTIASHIKN